MDELELAPKESAASVAYKRELWREANNTIMVYNPTTEDCYCIYDKFRHLIPSKNKNIGFGNGKSELPAYIARKYVSEMTVKLINEQNETEYQRRLDERAAKGMPAFETKWEENKKLIDNLPKTNDPNLVAKIGDMLWLGVVREYAIEDISQTEAMSVDQRTDDERLRDMFANKRYSPVATEEAPQLEENPPQAVKSKKKLYEEVVINE